jgi:hypothetical protein
MGRLVFAPLNKIGFLGLLSHGPEGEGPRWIVERWVTPVPPGINKQVSNQANTGEREVYLLR